MRKIIKHVALLAVALIASPAVAADNLACMNSGYDDEELTHFAQFVAHYDLAQWGAGTSPYSTEIRDALTNRAGQCAVENGWSPIAVESAVSWRLAEFLWAALRLSDQITPAEATQLASATDAADRPRLYRIFGMDVAGIASIDYETLPPEDDVAYLTSIASQGGIPLDSDRSQLAGAMMAARILKHYSAERFSAN